MRKTIVTLLLASLAGAAQSAVVYLKGGGTMEGTVVSSTDRQVILNTAQGQVSIGLDRVERIDYAEGASPAPVASEPPLAQYPPARWRWRRRIVENEASYGAPAQTLSFDFGVDAPLNDVSLSGTSGGDSASDGIAGPLFGVQYLYHPVPRLGWGLEFHYYDRSGTDSPDLLPSSDSHVFGDTLLLLGVMKCSLTDRGPVRPYVLLGLGGHRTTTTIDSHPSPGYAWSDTQTTETRRVVDDSALGLAASARLGLDFGFAGPFTFGVEAGWTGLTSATYQATAQGRALGISGVSGPLNYFTFAGRWGFDF